MWEGRRGPCWQDLPPSSQELVPTSAAGPGVQRPPVKGTQK